jgi:hypothetical protein
VNSVGSSPSGDNAAGELGGQLSPGDTSTVSSVASSQSKTTPPSSRPSPGRRERRLSYSTAMSRRTSHRSSATTTTLAAQLGSHLSVGDNAASQLGELGDFLSHGDNADGEVGPSHGTETTPSPARWTLGQSDETSPKASSAPLSGRDNAARAAILSCPAVLAPGSEPSSIEAVDC